MSVRPILKMGDPRLLRKSMPVREFGTPELKALLDDMFETMTAADGAGLAAPQIGVPLKVVIFGFENNRDLPETHAIPKTVLINPVIRPVGDMVEEAWEGCLSVPGMRGVVPRWSKVHYEGFDQNGQHISREATGFHARVVQHELDHLEGILYPMRMRDLSLFGFIEAMDTVEPEE
ncbi:MAG: peptide deformylase [Burkholderiaceae bacterium]|jgi:peptide deformylase|nr:peptide deformylase [Burkholderiaceae bacterium]